MLKELPWQILIIYPSLALFENFSSRHPVRHAERAESSRKARQAYSLLLGSLLCKGAGIPASKWDKRSRQCQHHLPFFDLCCVVALLAFYQDARINTTTTSFESRDNFFTAQETLSCLHSPHFARGSGSFVAMAHLKLHLVESY